jgi:hypothetical protein
MQSFLQKPLGRSRVTRGTQEKVDRRPGRIHRAL